MTQHWPDYIRMRSTNQFRIFKTKYRHHNQKRYSVFLRNHWYQAIRTNPPHATSPYRPNIGRFQNGVNCESEINPRIKLPIVIVTHLFFRI